MGRNELRGKVAGHLIAKEHNASQLDAFPLGGASAAAVGSEKAEWITKRGLPSSAESYVLKARTSPGSMSG
eukprot:CAMPEP_0178391134 /NCGR_PEP_ID=MMETSP0689_2-20121128/11007_1 /TAXON_ID=160604 /ORGANISM="Amphidinium massartii, Strain CS-259" /LENGTH=70 /DNA_ID=CAMNT_0020011669 /DNA_START=273 /DNA_END=488 /DNA_ORIENTATION=-